jgi:hypothetical protein
LPRIDGVILPLVVGSTVVFEVAGPIFTRWALLRSGETGQAPNP